MRYLLQQKSDGRFRTAKPWFSTNDNKRWTDDGSRARLFRRPEDAKQNIPINRRDIPGYAQAAFGGRLRRKLFNDLFFLSYNLVRVEFRIVPSSDGA